MPMPDPSVMLQEIYLANYSTPPSGTQTGSWDNPFYAASDTLSDAASAALFDGIMNDPSKVGQGQSVRLLPGVFRTAGHPGTSAPGGWSARNGVRIVGSGMGVTTLKLVTSPGNTRYAAGTDFEATSLTGFEMSDLTIDCNLPAAAPAGTGAGAIRVRGTHVFLRRIRIINYGGRGLPGSISIVTAAGDNSENCVIEDCVADIPAAAHDSPANIFCFEGRANSHRFCAIRNCAVRGGTSYENPVPAMSAPELLRAICPGVGLGTVIEGNQIVNCHIGVSYLATSGDQPAKDIVIWNNILRNVWRGIRFENGSAVSSPVVGRVLISDNFIELATAGGSQNGPKGIYFSSGQNGTRFKQVIIRKNLIGAVMAFDPISMTTTGIEAERCGELIAENNIISDTAMENGVRFSNCASRKFFNNQNKSGQRLRGYDGTSYVQELEDQLEDALLPL